MSSGTLLPAPYFTILDATGVAVAGTVEFFASGTSAHQPAYADGALTVPLANPASADSAGRLVAYLSATSYKLVIRDAVGGLLRTVDPVTSTASSGSGLIGAALGQVFVFGGDPTSPVTLAAYPSGATFDKLHAGTAVMNLDSATLAPGTYVIEIMGIVADEVATISAALVNLSAGAPDTPLATATATSQTGEVARSGAIIFGAAGSTFAYGIKTKISTGSGEVFGIKLVRTV